jgi:hypothetical protein
MNGGYMTNILIDKTGLSLLRVTRILDTRWRILDKASLKTPSRARHKTYQPQVSFRFILFKQFGPYGPRRKVNFLS